MTIWDDRGANPPCMAGPTFTFTTCPDTFYLGSTDGGATWGAEVPVAYSGAALAGRNDVAVAGSASVVINFNRAAENTADANPHMFAVRSRDNGATWDAPVQLTNTPGQADHGSIIGDGRDVHLAWHDSRDGALAIFYSRSSDEGATWSAAAKISAAGTAEASTPLIAATATAVHVTWLDRRSGTYQIYYRRDPLPVPPALDGGVPDAAGGDAPAPAPDGGASATGDAGGCGCATSGAPTAGWLSAGVVAGLRRRRRRSR